MRRLSNTWKILVVLTLLALVFSIGAERILAAPVVPISDEGARVQPVSPAAPAAAPDPSAQSGLPSTQSDGGSDGKGSCGDFCGFLQDILEVIAKFFEALIHAIAWFFLFGANALISAALTFNAQIGQDLIARKGYNIVLGIANMGFLVALVVIAFATMFRQEGFGYKKALPRVIIAALLINFGFSIVTNWFIEPVTLVTNAIHNASGFNPAGSFFNDFVQDVASWDLGKAFDLKTQGDWAALAEPFAKVLFTFFLDFLAIIALFAFAAMLWIRYIALVILIILLPLAWVGWIFPNLKVPGGGNPWGEWWESFIRWLLFAPFAMFFFWLALSFTHNSPSPLDAVTAGVNPGQDGFPQTALADIAGMIVIIGILVGGLIVSNKMGISGASYALAISKKGGNWMQTKGRKIGRRVGRGTIRKALPAERLKKLENYNADKGFFRRNLAAPARAVGRKVVRTDAATTKAREAEFLEQNKNLAPYQKSAMYAGLSKEKRAYLLKDMIKEGYDWELVPGAREDIVKWTTKKKDKGGREISGSSAFDRDLYGLKKAELDLVDAGISPDALAKMEPYRERLETAVTARDAARKTGDDKTVKENEEEIERIKYILGLEVEEILRKDMNVITPNGMGKLQRRVDSDTPPDGKRPGKYKVGYAMFGDDEVGAISQGVYGGARRRYLAMDRAESLRRAKGNTRSDGNRNYSVAGVESLDTVKDWFVAPLLDIAPRAEVRDEKAFRDMDAPAQITLLQKYWPEVQAAARVKVREAVDKKRDNLGLDPGQYARALEIELAKVDKAIPDNLIGNLRELVSSSRGAAHATLAI